MRTRGFTLVETLLYVSIISLMLLLLSALLFLILQAKTKYQTMAEVNQAGIQISQEITRVLRDAKKINIPVAGSNGNSLSVDRMEAGKTPTLLSISGSALTIKEGVGSIVSLTSSRVLISGVNFQNVSGTNTPGIIRFQFTLTHINSSGRNEYDFLKTFTGGVALR